MGLFLVLPPNTNVYVFLSCGVHVCASACACVCVRARVRVCVYVCLEGREWVSIKRLGGCRFHYIDAFSKRKMAEGKGRQEKI